MSASLDIAVGMVERQVDRNATAHRAADDGGPIDPALIEHCEGVGDLRPRLGFVLGVAEARWS